jgi:hypothetical protein
LSSKQEAAASLILSSKDRIVAIQGVAGAGKSTMLQPVTRIAQAQGVPLSPWRWGRKLPANWADLGIASSSVQAFLYRHRGLLMDDGAPSLIERSHHELASAVLIVDEASTLSSRQAADLMRVPMPLASPNWPWWATPANMAPWKRASPSKPCKRAASPPPN